MSSSNPTLLRVESCVAAISNRFSGGGSPPLERREELSPSPIATLQPAAANSRASHSSCVLSAQTLSADDLECAMRAKRERDPLATLTCGDGFLHTCGGDRGYRTTSRC